MTTKGEKMTKKREENGGGGTGWEECIEATALTMVKMAVSSEFPDTLVS